MHGRAPQLEQILLLTGNLLVQGSNIITSLASKRNISDSYSKTETETETMTGYVYDSTVLKDSILTDILRRDRKSRQYLYYLCC